MTNFKNTILKILGITVISTIVAFPTLAQTDKDTVRWDSRTFQWVYRVFNPSDPIMYEDVTYTPRTLIEPMVKSSVRWGDKTYEYRYRIANGGAARQSISNISVRAPKWDAQIAQQNPLPPKPIWEQISKRARARMAAEKAFTEKTVYVPNNHWEAFLNISQPTRVVFGWLADLQPGFSGIVPRTNQTGFTVLRTELPGAGWMAFKGDTPDIYNAATLPSSGAVADHVAEMLSEDAVSVPVIIPAIIVPIPYDAPELIRRIKLHATTWVESGLVDRESLNMIIPYLDEISNALLVSNKIAARHTINGLTTQINRMVAGIKNEEIEEDNDRNFGEAEKRKIISWTGELEDISNPLPSLNRVAARSLLFNLSYMVQKMN